MEQNTENYRLELRKTASPLDEAEYYQLAIWMPNQDILVVSFPANGPPIVAADALSALSRQIIDGLGQNAEQVRH